MKRSRMCSGVCVSFFLSVVTYMIFTRDEQDSRVQDSSYLDNYWENVNVLFPVTVSHFGQCIDDAIRYTERKKIEVENLKKWEESPEGQTVRSCQQVDDSLGSDLGEVVELRVEEVGVTTSETFPGLKRSRIVLKWSNGSGPALIFWSDHPFRVGRQWASRRMNNAALGQVYFTKVDLRKKHELGADGGLPLFPCSDGPVSFQSLAVMSW